MRLRTSVIGFVIGLAALAVPAPRADRPPGGSDDDVAACSETAATLFTACGLQAEADEAVADAVCLNTIDPNERQRCSDDATAARAEADQLCAGQRDTRLYACLSLGEGRYDPEIEPVMFESKTANLAVRNPYFPLQVGNRWKYTGGIEVNTVEVTKETKSIDGVTCLVVRDLVYSRGVLSEATDDWYGQNKDGTVWYFGEETKDYEIFKGDNPVRPELVDIGGSFKAGRNGDKPGIIFLASPKVGDSYVEEASLANAEDVTDILSTTYAYGRDPDLDTLVPRKLAELFCAAGDCVVTRNYSLLEPGIFDRKYYARGIGVFLETVPATGEVNRLVDCSFDSRCNTLPQP